MSTTPNKGGILSGTKAKKLIDAIDSITPAVGCGSRTTRGYYPKSKSDLFGAMKHRLTSFYWKQAGDQVEVLEGSCIVANTVYDVSTTTVTLSGSTEYVYVYHKKDHSSSGVTHSSTDPGCGDATEWRWRLAKFVSSVAGHYTVSHIYRSPGDVEALSALR